MSVSQDCPQTELVVQLHSAARRYCQEQYAHWSQVYAEMESSSRVPVRSGGWNYSQKAKETFPRYNVLVAILAAIEAMVPEQLGDLAATRSQLISLGYRAESPLHSHGNDDDIILQAVEQERDRFADFIETVDETTLWEVRLLPYKRTLSPEEIEKHWSELDKRWRVTGHWIPLENAKIREPFIVVNANAFRRHLRPGRLQRMVRNHLGVDLLYELREHEVLSSSFHMDVALLQPTYNGAEGFWFPETKNWLLYASHENSVTAAGEKLVAAIADLWPEYRHHPWSWD